jgi:hypothetical protein
MPKANLLLDFMASTKLTLRENLIILASLSIAFKGADCVNRD